MADAEQDATTDTPRDLSTEERARFAALAEAGRELLAGAADSDESFAAALAAFTQIGSAIKQDAWLSALHVPSDAAEHETGLRRVLARIPDGWGRWISCSKGWYPIITKLDGQISALDPLYRVEQVKEKYGGLRYYCTYSSLRSHYERLCPQPPDATAEQRKQWRENFEAFCNTEAGQELARELKTRSEQISLFIKQAEVEAEQTCERCGQPGKMCVTQGRSPWYRTLCESCAIADGYVSHAEWTAWYQQQKPLFEAEDRLYRQQQHDQFIADFADKRVVYAGGENELAVPASRPTDAPAAHAAGLNDWDAIFIYADDLGQALINGLSEHYAEYLAANRQAQAEFERQQKQKRTAGWPPVFQPKPPEGLREITVAGPFNTIETGALHELGITVRCSADYQFADFKA